jgi:two-component system, cell cycle sensor histidine kinase and response regulator CckA
MTSGRVAYETARLRLARYRVEGEQARSRAAAHATQVSAEALGVQRVGLWLFRERHQKLLCVCQYDRESREHASGQTLLVSRYPVYMASLLERRVIAAENAREHPMTRELADGYLAQHGIGALLDAPVIRDGKVIGVVCHEHVGATRHWTPRELEFASAVADMVTSIFEQSERLELEAALQDQAEQRQESQKMEALGRMACAVAHDFNNVLSVIGLWSSRRARAAPGEPDLATMGQRVEEAVNMGQRLTQQLLAFGRARSENAKASADLGQVLTRMRELLASAVGGHIELNLRLTAREARVAADASQLEQVVLNLVLNARDAIAEQGRVDVLLRDPEDGEEVAPDSLVLEVSDDGKGMDEPTRARIFEPFFTTKRVGSGLGLATVYGIVRRAGGSVSVISAPGTGTRMLVALPRGA